MPAHFSTTDLAELLATFIIANVASESIKYLVTKIWIKVDSKNNTFLDVE